MKKFENDDGGMVIKMLFCCGMVPLFSIAVCQFTAINPLVIPALS
jgi:hypothetical protein